MTRFELEERARYALRMAALRLEGIPLLVAGWLVSLGTPDDVRGRLTLRKKPEPAGSPDRRGTVTAQEWAETSALGAMEAALVMFTPRPKGDAR